MADDLNQRLDDIEQAVLWLTRWVIVPGDRERAADSLEEIQQRIADRQGWA